MKSLDTESVAHRPEETQAMVSLFGTTYGFVARRWLWRRNSCLAG